MLDGPDVVLTERRGHVLVVTFNREERRNAMSFELRERFDEELGRFNRDPDLWVLVLTGAGDRAFSSGMDLKDFAARQKRGESMYFQPRGRAHPAVDSWKPMIAAINGDALAGGWSLAQRCDLRVAVDAAQLAITENRWNLPAPFSAEQGVFATRAQASEVAMLGLPITAQRAYEMGFVNRVVAPGAAMDAAMEWAEHLCTLGQESLRAHKKLQYYGRWAPPAEVAGLSEDLFYWTGNKPGVVVDPTVGPRAFALGQTPDYSEMFELPRLRCEGCGSEYVVARTEGAPSPTCCGRALT